MSEPNSQAADESTGKTIIGIDLGTTNSVVAVMREDGPEVLPIDGAPSMPSVVGLDKDGKLITGTIARNQLAAFPERTLASIKRRMGTMEPVSMGDQTYTPPEISAMILRRLRDVASEALSVSVEDAVITVPAFFNEAQRQATREAGRLAGLNVRRIINEPTAATLVYHAGTDDPKHVAVYDFGGGTFDVSIVRIEAGVTEVLASRGDTHLGGDDLDSALLEHIASAFNAQHGLDLRDQTTPRYRLLQACENAKMRLSTDESAEIAEEFIAEMDGKPLNLHTSIEREQFEDLIDELIDRTIECVKQALADASLTYGQIDDLILVGGSTRIPKVAATLRQQFGLEPSHAVDPDLAVGLGAAVQGAMLSGQLVGPVLIDVATHTLGIAALSGGLMGLPTLEFVPLIRRGTALPARFEERFSTMHENQKSVSIEVFQGDDPDPKRNELIGEMDLDVHTGADQSKILVCFDLTLDGTLKVTAKQPSSGRMSDISIDNALSQFSGERSEHARDRLANLFDDSPEFEHARSNDESDRSVIIDGPHSSADPPSDQYRKATELLRKAEEMADKVQGEDADELATLQKDLAAAIEAGDDENVDELTADLDDLLFYVR